MIDQTLKKKKDINALSHNDTVMTLYCSRREDAHHVGADKEMIGVRWEES